MAAGHSIEGPLLDYMVDTIDNMVKFFGDEGHLREAELADDIVYFLGKAKERMAKYREKRANA
jgi:hypothetical protein